MKSNYFKHYNMSTKVEIQIAISSIGQWFYRTYYGKTLYASKWIAIDSLEDRIYVENDIEKFKNQYGWEFEGSIITKGIRLPKKINDSNNNKSKAFELCLKMLGPFITFISEEDCGNFIVKKYKISEKQYNWLSDVDSKEHYLQDNYTLNLKEKLINFDKDKITFSIKRQKHYKCPSYINGYKEKGSYYILEQYITKHC